jgi:hypothetical protein
MAFIAALIAAEKLLPWRVATSRVIAVLLLVLGLSVAITPSSVPGLTLPDSPEAMKAMRSMEGGSMDSMNGGSMDGDSMKGSGMNDKPMGSKQGSMDGHGMHGKSGSMHSGNGGMK